MASTTTVDVVVPTYNNLPELKACLASIEAHAEAGVRVIVCIDGSTDGTREWLSRTSFRLPVKSLEHPDRDNRGRAATRNLAVGSLEGEVVLLLDSDMRLQVGAIEAHVRLLGRHRCVSVGSIRYENAREDLWAAYLSSRGRARYGDGARLPFNQFVTANSAMRSVDFVASGGFDASIRAYAGEDTEFAYRLQSVLGLPILYNAMACAVAREPKTLASALAQLHEYGRTNLHYIHSKHPDMPHVFMTDRLTSPRLRDRAFRAVMNPLTDAVAKSLVRYAPLPIKRQAINYLVIRAVTGGWIEGSVAD